MKTQILFDVWESTAGSRSVKCDAVEKHVITSLGTIISTKNQLEIHEKVRKFCSNLYLKWKHVNRHKERFLKSYESFLNKEIVFAVSTDAHSVEPSTSNEPDILAGPGRPQKPFEQLTARSKRRRVQRTLSLEENELLYATEMKLRKSGKRTNAALVRQATSSTPKRTRLMKKAWKSITPRKLATLSESQALSMIAEADLSKHQYITIRNMLKSLDIKVLPNYNKIVFAKNKCYPPEQDIVVTESTAEIKLQGLLDHTTSRIVESHEEVLSNFQDEELSRLVLISKWGFDGSTGHSEYHQMSEEPFSDKDLFVSSMVPLQLHVEKGKKSDNKILWKNPRPASTRYCRPIKLQFKKENVDLSKEEEARVQSQIDALHPTRLNIFGRDMAITHKMSLTMVDGKVCNALSSTDSAQVCYVCGASPKDMNNIDTVLQRPVDTSTFRFGLSTLHAWIRFYEYFLHVAYRMDIKKWQARSSTDKAALKTRKTSIQDKFYNSELGLIVDRVKPGGAGTSNNGNAARRFFHNPELSASITGIEESLIRRCCVILETISSPYEINAEAFDMYAVETARTLVTKYPWYKLPASVHKILVHGSKIIEAALLPIGQLSEEASESRNKDLKSYREKRTRKMSRKLTNVDLLHRLLLTSDPVITSLRVLPKKGTFLLSQDVQALLKAPEAPELSSEEEETEE